MKYYRFINKNIVLILFMLPLMGGCSKDIKGYEKIVGTATVNGQNYEESTVWAWNYNGYPSDIALFVNYKLFHYLARLSPEKGNSPRYTIYFYASENDKQIKLNHPYKLDFYKELDVESLFWGDVIPYFSENKSKVLTEGSDGIAYAISSDDEIIPLKGEIVVKEIGPERNVCYGSYSLTSSENDLVPLVIKGEFETLYSITEETY